MRACAGWLAQPDPPSALRGLPPHHPFPRYLTQSLPILVIIAVVLALSAVRALQRLQNRVFGGSSQTLLGAASVTSMGTSAVLAGMFMLYIGEQTLRV